MRKKPLAVVTMVYNEKTLLPVWLRHYGREVGPENCFILDHGSDDGSTEGVGAQVIRLGRCPHHELQRAESASAFCNALLYAYDRVLYTDADELVVADPAVADSLTAYAGRPDVPDLVNCFGMDVHHDGAGEPPLDWSRPIGEQRRLVRSVAGLCKPTYTGRRIVWSAGFHFATDRPKIEFGDLFLFHLAYADNDLIVARQRRRNAVTTATISESHHAIPPDALLGHMRRIVATYPREEDELRRGARRFEAVKRHYAAEMDHLRLPEASSLSRLPARFRALI